MLHLIKKQKKKKKRKGINDIFSIDKLSLGEEKKEHEQTRRDPKRARFDNQKNAI
jgi:hypothetical protein